MSELGDGSGLRVVQRLNGEVLQDGSTSDLIFAVPFLVSYISAVFTLEPGDLILTGTPPGVGWAREPKVSLVDGDVVEVEVEGIGVLSNPVVARLTRRHSTLSCTAARLLPRGEGADEPERSRARDDVEQWPRNSSAFSRFTCASVEVPPNDARRTTIPLDTNASHQSVTRPLDDLDRQGSPSVAGPPVARQRSSTICFGRKRFNTGTNQYPTAQPGVKRRSPTASSARLR